MMSILPDYEETMHFFNINFYYMYANSYLFPYVTIKRVLKTKMKKKKKKLMMKKRLTKVDAMTKMNWHFSSK